MNNKNLSSLLPIHEKLLITFGGNPPDHDLVLALLRVYWDEFSKAFLSLDPRVERAAENIYFSFIANLISTAQSLEESLIRFENSWHDCLDSLQVAAWRLLVFELEHAGCSSEALKQFIEETLTTRFEKSDWWTRETKNNLIAKIRITFTNLQASKYQNLIELLIRAIETCPSEMAPEILHTVFTGLNGPQETFPPANTKMLLKMNFDDLLRSIFSK